MKTYEQYKNLRELKSEIRNTKKRLVNDIMKRVRPYMWESGFCKPNSSDAGLKLVCWENKDYYIVKGMDKKSEGIGGFTENNTMIIDAYGGGLMTTELHSFPIETLINIWAWVERNGDKFKQAYTHYSKKEAA